MQTVSSNILYKQILRIIILCTSVQSICNIAIAYSDNTNDSQCTDYVDPTAIPEVCDLEYPRIKPILDKRIKKSIDNQQIVYGEMNFSFQRHRFPIHDSEQIYAKNIYLTNKIYLRYQIPQTEITLLYLLPLDKRFENNVLTSIGIEYTKNDFKLQIGAVATIADNLIVSPSNFSHLPYIEDNLGSSNFSHLPYIEDNLGSLLYPNPGPTKIKSYQRSELLASPSIRSFSVPHESGHYADMLCLGMLYENANIAFGMRYSPSALYHNFHTNSHMILTLVDDKNVSSRFAAYQNLIELGIKSTHDLESDTQIQYGVYYKHGQHDSSLDTNRLANKYPASSTSKNKGVVLQKNPLNLLQVGGIISKNNLSLGISYTNFFNTFSSPKTTASNAYYGHYTQLGASYTQGPIGIGLEATVGSNGPMKMEMFSISTTCNLGWFTPYIGYSIYRGSMIDANLTDKIPHNYDTNHPSYYKATKVDISDETAVYPIKPINSMWHKTLTMGIKIVF